MGLFQQIFTVTQDKYCFIAIPMEVTLIAKPPSQHIKNPFRHDGLTFSESSAVRNRRWQQVYPQWITVTILAPVTFLWIILKVLHKIITNCRVLKSLGLICNPLNGKKLLLKIPCD